MGVNHELRRLRIGGSEIGAIAGIDARRDAYSIYCEKKGLLPRSPSTPRMNMGKLFEKAIVECYAEITGRRTRFVDESIPHPTLEFVVATPDALCVDVRRGVDAKLVHWDQRHRWLGEPPAELLAQMHWYMLALDIPTWDVIAVIDGIPNVFPLERDAGVEEDLLAVGREFYERYLIGNEVPEPGGSEATKRALQIQFPRHKLDVRPATNEELALLAQLADVRAKNKETSKERARLEAILKLAIGHGEGLEWETGRVTWRSSKDKTVTDWQSIARGYLTKLTPEEREFVESNARTTEPGGRRFLFRGEAGGIDVIED